MAANAEGAAERPEMVSLPRATVQEILSTLWILRFEEEREGPRGRYTLEVPLETVIEAGLLIQKIEAALIPGGGDDGPLSGPAPWRD